MKWKKILEKRRIAYATHNGDTFANDLFWCKASGIPLHQSHRRTVGDIEADDEVDGADVEPLLGDASGDQSVAGPLAELPHHAQLLLLRDHRLAVFACHRVGMKRLLG